ncbi:MAG: hypothetical protein LBL69_04440, partial [Zoogloeaceae bacterium]|nr:hypothetical protein [Zoogloeaceae bacterium]
RYGREIPDEEYTTADFERRVALRARTQAVARHLTDFLKKIDRFAKTIVFCVDQEHAAEMRTALANLNADLVAQYPDYVCRVTAIEGDVGKGHMQRFQDVETRTPAILTSSQLLTTGLDAPTCKNVALVRLVNSMAEFKQIIGRGTRVREDCGKLWFSILDYTGSATRNFADPEFDGAPALATQEEIDEAGRTQNEIVEVPEEETPDEANPPLPIDETGTQEEGEGGGTIIDPPPPEPPRKFYFDGGQVEIVSEMVHELDAEGRQLRVVRYTDYAAERVRALCCDWDGLHAAWLDAARRVEIIHALAERGIDFTTLAEQAKQPEADPFDLLCHLAFNAPMLTRRQRAERVKKEEAAFFARYGEEARAILDELLEKYADTGDLQIFLPDKLAETLKLPPISRHGNTAEIIEKFGGDVSLRNAVEQLQALLYAA